MAHRASPDEKDRGPEGETPAKRVSCTVTNCWCTERGLIGLICPDCNHASCFHAPASEEFAPRR